MAGARARGGGKGNGKGANDADKDPFGFMQRYLVTRSEGLRKSGVQYSPLGHLITTNILHQRMCARLQHVDFMKRHPQVGDIPVRSPIFVIGFPRTGTTFLHEMLGLHPAVRMHYTHEQMSYVPTSHEETAAAQRADKAARYARNSKRFDTLIRLAGDNIQRIHRIGYDEPEECTTPCAAELPWAISELPLMVCASADVLRMGCGRAFDLYKQYLQILAWQTAGGSGSGDAVADATATTRMQSTSGGAASIGQDKTWMLKCPFHLPYLRQLFAAFPDATVVWTHRDPVECIASACSLYVSVCHTLYQRTSSNLSLLCKHGTLVHTHTRTYSLLPPPPPQVRDAVRDGC